MVGVSVTHVVVWTRTIYIYNVTLFFQMTLAEYCMSHFLIASYAITNIGAGMCTCRKWGAWASYVSSPSSIV